MVSPIAAQLDVEPVQLPDGTLVVPDETSGEILGGTDSGNEEEVQTTEDNNDFVSGIAVGAAVGFVGGAIIAWFLKPSDY